MREWKELIDPPAGGLQRLRERLDEPRRGSAWPLVAAGALATLALWRLLAVAPSPVGEGHVLVRALRGEPLPVGIEVVGQPTEPVDVGTADILMVRVVAR